MSLHVHLYCKYMVCPFKIEVTAEILKAEVKVTHDSRLLMGEFQGHSWENFKVTHGRISRSLLEEFQVHSWKNFKFTHGRISRSLMGEFQGQSWKDIKINIIKTHKL